jgi:hypothetical protein
MAIAQYDVVRVTKLRTPKRQLADASNLRAPAVGDIATVLEIYDHPAGYKLECSDENGITQWLVAFRAEDIDLQPVN